MISCLLFSCQRVHQLKCSCDILFSCYTKKLFNKDAFCRYLIKIESVVNGWSLNPIIMSTIYRPSLKVIFLVLETQIYWCALLDNVSGIKETEMEGSWSCHNIILEKMDTRIFICQWSSLVKNVINTFENWSRRDNINSW